MKRLREKLNEICRKLLPLLRRMFVLPPGVILVLFPATMVMCIIALNNRGMFPSLECRGVLRYFWCVKVASGAQLPQVPAHRRRGAAPA